MLMEAGQGEEEDDDRTDPACLVKVPWEHVAAAVAVAVAVAVARRACWRAVKPARVARLAMLT